MTYVLTKGYAGFWPDEIKRLRLSWSLIAAALVTLLFTYGKSLIPDPDIWWHVKVGLDMMSGTFPTVDVYSHTEAGKPWIAKEWLSQILIASTFKVTGWTGVAFLGYGSIFLTIFLFVWYLTKNLKPSLAVAISFLISALLAYFFNTRPFLFTFPIIIIWAASLFNSSERGTSPSFWMLALIWLWANLHAAFTFGFVIAFFAALDFVNRVGFSRPRELARWIAFGILCPLVTLLNPYGLDAILATFSVAHGNAAVQFITEWRPFIAPVNWLQEAVLLLALFALLVLPTRFPWPRAAFTLLSLHLFLIHLRFGYLLYLLVPIILAPEIARQHGSLSLGNWAAQPRDRFEKLLAAKFPYLAGGLLAVSIVAAAVSAKMFSSAPPETTSARGALAFAAAAELKGNVYNSYDFGGTLIFHGIKTFIDGRTDQLFLGKFVTDYFESGSSAGKPLLERQLKAHDVGWALLTSTDPRIPFFDELDGWERVYGDENAVIYALR